MMTRKTIILTLTAALLLLALAGCGGTDAGTSEAPAPEARTITQEEAQQIMDSGEDIVIVDVRTEEEYAEGHIPGAICIPNETITTEMPAELPDPDQKILVYCRTGRRSGEASAKLAAMGYTDINDFGGITTWKGDVET